MTPKEMGELRLKLIGEVTADLANAKTTEDRSKAEAKMAEARELGLKIALSREAEQVLAEERARVEAEEAAIRSGRPPLPQPGATNKSGNADKRSAEEIAEASRERTAAIVRYLATGEQAELRAMGAASGSTGGYGVATDMAGSIEQAILTFGGVAQYLGQLSTDNGEQINYPKSNDTANAATIIGENSGDASEEDLVLGTAASTVSTFTTGAVLVSNQLLQDFKFDLAAFINQNMIERSNRGLASSIMAGSGDGNFDALKAVQVGYTTPAGQIAALGLTDVGALFQAVDPAYAARGRWVMNRATQMYLGNLRNQYGTPIFPLDPDGLLRRLYGQDIVVDTTTPNIGAGLVPIVFGDLSKYLLRRVSGFAIKRLDERYAMANQTAFVGFFRAGGRSLDAGTHPIQTLKMAAA